MRSYTLRSKLYATLWANRYRGDCVSIDNDPRPGRPKTSTDERRVKLVADALEEDCEGLCKARYVSIPYFD